MHTNLHECFLEQRLASVKNRAAFVSIRVHWWFRLTLFCAIGGLAEALTLSADDETARQTALQWLQVIDSGNYTDAAQMMAEEVRGEQDWASHFATHRAPLGPVKNRRFAELRRAATIPEIPGARNYLFMQFKSSFERKSGAIEEVVLVKMGCCWEVCRYSIMAVNR